MTKRGVTLILALVAVVGACHDSTIGLWRFETDFLAEDVVDFMTVVFQSGENAFLGDVVDAGDVIDPAAPGNNFTVRYELPADFRLNLGFGFGNVFLQILEDGVPHPDPLGFSFATTAADRVEIRYDLRYRGEANLTTRSTDVDLAVTVTLDRGPLGFGDAYYFIEGFVDLGPTFCSIQTDFTAAGAPRDGIDPGSGDGTGVIDDPDIFDLFAFDIDYFLNTFRAEGKVGCCAFYEDFFSYAWVM